MSRPKKCIIMLRFLLMIALLIVLLDSCIKETHDDECITPYSFAGNDQILLLLDSTKLNASKPKDNEHSSWHIIGGGNYKITDDKDPQSFFKGEKGVYYKLIWTTENTCGKTASDTVAISFDCMPIICNAGEDQFGINNYTTKLNASALLAGERGYWSVIKGEGGQLEDSTSGNTTLNVLEEGIYLITWTVINNCKKSNKDTVKIEFISPFNYGSLTDIDGNVYKTVQIGSQVWMAENLKTTKYNDGSPINYLTTNQQWSNTSQGGYCWYNNDIQNKDLYGAIYNFYLTDDKVCPIGWHVPTDNEWLVLMKYIDGDTYIYNEGYYNSANDFLADRWLSNAGEKYVSRKDGGTNDFGFSAIKSSQRGTNCILLNGEILYDFSGPYYFPWWSSTEYPGSGGGIILIDHNQIYQQEHCETWGMAIRCIKD
jgi:uncharacterized protein (TIGR02145 family)